MKLIHFPVFTHPKALILVQILSTCLLKKNIQACMSLSRNNTMLCAVFLQIDGIKRCLVLELRKLMFKPAKIPFHIGSYLEHFVIEQSNERRWELVSKFVYLKFYTSIRFVISMLELTHRNYGNYV